MATYKEVRGTKIREYTTNPDNPIEGDVWYNQTDNVSKYEISNVLSSWRSGGNLNSARSEGGSSGSSATAALLFGGYDPSDHTTKTESYNGVSWTEVNDLNTARNGIWGAGPYTSAIFAGGDENAAGSASALVNQKNGMVLSWAETA